MRVYPPSCSRVSAKGPSVSRRWPLRTRTVVAELEAWSGRSPQDLALGHEALHVGFASRHLGLLVGLAHGEPLLFVQVCQQHVFHRGPS
jgi:hypothetical protein